MAWIYSFVHIIYSKHKRVIFHFQFKSNETFTSQMSFFRKNKLSLCVFWRKSCPPDEIPRLRPCYNMLYIERKFNTNLWKSSKKIQDRFVEYNFCLKQCEIIVNFKEKVCKKFLVFSKLYIYPPIFMIVREFRLYKWTLICWRVRLYSFFFKQLNIIFILFLGISCKRFLVFSKLDIYTSIFMHDSPRIQAVYRWTLIFWRVRLYSWLHVDYNTIPFMTIYIYIYIYIYNLETIFLKFGRSMSPYFSPLHKPVQTLNYTARDSTCITY